MPNVAVQWKRFLLAIDFFVLLGVELAALLILSLMGGGPLAVWVDTGRNILKLRKTFGSLPYDEVLALAKKHGDTKDSVAKSAAEKNNDSSRSGTEAFPDAQEFSKRDLAFYAFTVKPQSRQGVWALMACFFCFMLIHSGVDWGILYLSPFVLMLFGIFRLVQGLMEVL